MTDQNKPIPAAIDGFDNTVYVANDDDYFSSITTSDHVYPVMQDADEPRPTRLSLDIDVSKCKFDAPSKTFFGYDPEPITQSHSWPIEVSIHRGGLKLAIAIADQKLYTDRYDAPDEYHKKYVFEKDSTLFSVKLYLTEKLRDYWFAMYRATRKDP